MMSQAFYTGLSGLKSSQTAINVISDNLSNISTVGFRGYSTEFSNIFEGMVKTNSGGSTTNDTNGLGVTASSVVMNENSGVMQLTDKSTDLAILGDGWFGIQAGGQPLYTRDGNFTFDANRDLVTYDGYHVLGTMGNNISNGVLTSPLISTPLGDINSQEMIKLPNELTFQAQPTTEVSFDGNLAFTENEALQEQAALDDIAANQLDPSHIISIDQVPLTMSTTVINSDGVRNNLRLEFTKVAPQVLPGSQWNISATVESKDGGTIFSTETGTVSFGENGNLISNTLISIDNEGSPININLGEDYTGLVSSSGPFSSSSTFDGLVSGELTGYEINKNGEVVAAFTNGQQSSVARVAIYHFANDRGLERINGARFEQSNNSGEPIFFKDSEGKSILGADIATGQLEGSNVRIEVGLTEMIIMQRSYDANSKSISTADQMLQKALSMDA